MKDLTPEVPDELERAAWDAWSESMHKLGFPEGAFTERDREIFLGGFALGRLDALRNPAPCIACGGEVGVLCPECAEPD